MPRAALNINANTVKIRYKLNECNKSLTYNVEVLYFLPKLGLNCLLRVHYIAAPMLIPKKMKMSEMHFIRQNFRRRPVERLKWSSTSNIERFSRYLANLYCSSSQNSCSGTNTNKSNVVPLDSLNEIGNKVSVKNLKAERKTLLDKSFDGLLASGLNFETKYYLLLD